MSRPVFIGWWDGSVMVSWWLSSFSVSLEEYLQTPWCFSRNVKVPGRGSVMGINFLVPKRQKFQSSCLETASPRCSLSLSVISISPSKVCWTLLRWAWILVCFCLISILVPLSMNICDSTGVTFGGRSSHLLLRAELWSPNSYVDILTPSVSECDYLKMDPLKKQLR